MGKSEQFDRDHKADTKDVVTRTVPLGYLPLLFAAGAILFALIATILWLWK
jgi:hypothetical protein